VTAWYLALSPEVAAKRNGQIDIGVAHSTQFCLLFSLFPGVVAICVDLYYWRYLIYQVARYGKLNRRRIKITNKNGPTQIDVEKL